MVHDREGSKKVFKGVKSANNKVSNNHKRSRKGDPPIMRKSLHALAAMLIAAIFTTAAYAAESHAAAAPAGVVNINTADAAQLALLPPVGAKAAPLIVDYRKELSAFNTSSALIRTQHFPDQH